MSNPQDAERRKLASIEAAARIISENPRLFILETQDTGKNEMNTAQAVKGLATLIYKGIAEIE